MTKLKQLKRLTDPQLRQWALENGICNPKAPLHSRYFVRIDDQSLFARRDDLLVAKVVRYVRHGLVGNDT